MPAKYQPIPTTYDGIEFRSRLEASWYAYFHMCGVKAEYEPCTFRIEDVMGEHCPGDNYLGTYLPDFRVWGLYVEIKPLIDRYEERDQHSISMAYILGYTHPTVVVLGSPLQYFACLINERHKGCPMGKTVRFTPGDVIETGDWGANCYPDENGLEDFEDPRENSYCHRFNQSPKYQDCGQVGKNAWNATKWKGR